MKVILNYSPLPKSNLTPKRFYGVGPRIEIEITKASHWKKL